MEKWVLRKYDDSLMCSLAKGLSIDPVAARLLAAKGISSVEEAEKYLNPSFLHLHDPFLFSEMKEAVTLFVDSVREGRKILIHGDYDADGICGTALLYEGLKNFGADLHFFVPDRAKDGYGLSMRVMKRGVDKDLGLLISTDCGSSDRDVVAFLSKHGVKTIITDHHDIDERIPEADIFINPKLPGEKYPFTELAGVGVAFKFLQALQQQTKKDLGLEKMLDLVAVGTLGDYVVLKDENRELVSLGMNTLSRWERNGFCALQASSNLPSSGFTARQICFNIVPRLNSPGRLGSARDTVLLLTTEDREKAFSIAEDIEEINSMRRSLDSAVTEEASYLADINIRKEQPNALVFSSESWHEGVVGIAASRLTEKYSLPAALIAVKGETGKGSVRSAGRINVRKILDSCSEYLVAFGGHREAGGFSIRKEDIYNFRNKFNKEAAGQYDTDTKGDEFLVDIECTVEQCDMEMVSFLKRMEPFGPGNDEPVFLIKGICVKPGSRIVGNGHLKVSGIDGKDREQDFIGFSLGRAWNPADIMGKRVDLLVNLRTSSWQGRQELQFQIKTIRYSEKEAGMLCD
ncbi:MAG: single-stranded-DNA-specific exonuclease RecJ [Candidatus Krumholzibacteriota bacterium]|nr:single-stranded-DNA-specific exonuclease RecJ [Candidatus Krumholzibacteriota bacterium]